MFGVDGSSFISVHLRNTNLPPLWGGRVLNRSPGLKPWAESCPFLLLHPELRRTRSGQKPNAPRSPLYVSDNKLKLSATLCNRLAVST
jgi:hypothetical protein